MQHFYGRLPLLVVALLVVSGVLSTFVEAAFAKTFYDAQLAKFVAPEDDAAARRYIDLLRTRDFNALEASFAPDAKKNTSRSALEQVATMLTAQQPQQTRLVGFHKFTSSSETDSDAVYELRFARWWTILVIDFKWIGRQSYLLGLHVQRSHKSLEATNAFNLRGKGLSQYLGLFITAVVLLGDVVTLFVCAGAPGLRRKWIWLAAIAIGFGQVWVNWTTGACAVWPVSFRVPVAGATHDSPYAPWVLYFTVPAGAIAFWISRFRKKRNELPERLPSSPPLAEPS